ncbi:MAG: sulfur carrier protein ThiS [Thermoanaerobaculia bacterium]
MSGETGAEVEVNGESRRLPPGASVDDLVRGLGRDPRTVAVEYNGEILARASYVTTVLASGDRLEIVHFVQGG